MKAKELKTAERLQQYHALKSLLETWEQRPEEEQIKNYDYIKKLRARTRQVKMYILHRREWDAIC